jgi:hypothetical protein
MDTLRSNLSYLEIPMIGDRLDLKVGMIAAFKAVHNVKPINAISRYERLLLKLYIMLNRLMGSPGRTDWISRKE